MANLLNFKFGKYGNLPVTKSAGTVYVTTDERAMYVDLPNATDASQIDRIRIGDIIIKDNVRDIEPPYYTDAFYYCTKENALLRWDGSEWKQINSTAGVEAQLQIVKEALNQEKTDRIAADTKHTNDIAAANTAISERLKTADFNTFKSENDAALAGLDTRITTAQAKADKAEGDAANAQNTANNALSIANAALPMSGTPSGKTMTGNINMGGKQITNLAAPTSDADAATKKYVDDGDAALLGASTNAAGATTIHGALKAAAAAQTTADKGVADAATAQGTANTAVTNAAKAQSAADQAQTTANKAVDDAKAANDNANTRLTTAAFNEFKAANDTELGTIKANVTTAQTTANKGVSDAATAKAQADKGVADAAAALAKANEMLPLKGGTMSGNIAMSGKKITGLGTPANDADAATKKYVDDAKAAASAVGTAAQKTANTALSTAQAALPKDGSGEMSGDLKMGGKKITNLATPTAGTDATTKEYVDTAIASGIKANDAMEFIGTLGGTNSTISALPTTATTYTSSDNYVKTLKPQKGHTFKVGAKGTYAGVEAKVGDLFINTGADDAAPNWVHVSSGYEDDYLQKLAVDNTTIKLTDGISDTAAVSGIAFNASTASNIKFTVTAGSGNTPIHAVTASMEWGTF